MKKSLALVLFLVLALVWADEKVFDDAVVVDASSSEYRSARQFIRQGFVPHPAAVGGVQDGIVVPPPLLQPAQTHNCLTREGKSGQCKAWKECYPYFRIFDLGSQDTWVMGSYNTCSFSGPRGKHVFGVCCANSDDEEEDVVDANEEEEKEEEGNAKKEEEEETFEGFDLGPAVNEKCGYRNFRIINGQIAGVNEFPFMVAMLNKRRQFCGGSLVDKKHILTAAHCVAHMSKYDVQNLRVAIGDHNLKQQGETRGEVYEYAVKRVIRHKKFDRVKLYNDVAILTLDKEVKYSPTVSPICLASNDNNKFTNEIVEVAGWGTTTPGGGSSSPVLRKVKVKVWPNRECKSSYGSDAPGGITNTMVCASLRGSKIQDSCSGDSGGALFKCSGARGPCEQVGIVSWGIGCAQAKYPGVYTRVSSFMPWISKIVKKY